MDFFWEMQYISRDCSSEVSEGPLDQGWNFLVSRRPELHYSIPRPIVFCCRQSVRLGPSVPILVTWSHGVHSCNSVNGKKNNGIQLIWCLVISWQISYIYPNWIRNQAQQTSMNVIPNVWLHQPIHLRRS